MKTNNNPRQLYKLSDAQLADSTSENVDFHLSLQTKKSDVRISWADHFQPASFLINMEDRTTRSRIAQRLRYFRALKAGHLAAFEAVKMRRHFDPTLRQHLHSGMNRCNRRIKFLIHLIN